MYVGHVGGALLLGVTRQLVGEAWLGARPFHYCGSVGPLTLSVPQRRAFEAVGAALVAAFGLRGLFGVDAVLRDGTPWPVEVNPRYTASVEVLEFATGVPALDLHRRAYQSDGLPTVRGDARRVVGKAVLFARADLRFPAGGPWEEALRSPGLLDEPPAFADIPDEGERLSPGQPVLTFFATAPSVGECLDRLRKRAAALNNS